MNARSSRGRGSGVGECWARRATVATIIFTRAADMPSGLGSSPMIGSTLQPWHWSANSSGSSHGLRHLLLVQSLIHIYFAGAARPCAVAGGEWEPNIGISFIFGVTSAVWLGEGGWHASYVFSDVQRLARAGHAMRSILKFVVGEQSSRGHIWTGVLV